MHAKSQCVYPLAFFVQRMKIRVYEVRLFQYGRYGKWTFSYVVWQIGAR